MVAYSWEWWLWLTKIKPKYAALFKSTHPQDFVIAHSLDRRNPTVLAPFPGQVIANGEQFKFAWDYLGPGAKTLPINYMMNPEFFQVTPGGTGNTLFNSEFLFNRTIYSNEFFSFSRTVEGIADIEKNRVLVTLEADELALPFDVEFRVGSHISMSQFVTLGDVSGLGFQNRPRVVLAYAHQNDPFTITISSVPEPSAFVLSLIFGIPLIFRTRTRP